MSRTVFTEAEIEDLERQRALPRFVFFPIGLLGLWMLADPWPSDDWYVIAFWSVFMGWVLFCYTSLFHETAHQTLTRNRSVSIWLGRLLGMVMCVPYDIYRESHIRHHAYLNKPNDWELWPYSDPNRSRTFRRIFVWFDLVLGIMAGPIVYGRIFFHKDSPLTNPDLRRRIRWQYVASAAFWVSALTALWYFDAFPLFIRMWLIPHAIGGVFQTGRKLTEHLGMASYDPLLGTRTVVGDSWFTQLCTYLNFEIFVHGPHHRHPRLSHHRLQEKMSEFLATHSDVQYPIYRTYWRATGSAIPWVFRNPGVGMNVGAPPPGEERQGDVENFVGDVTSEVLAASDAASPHLTN